MGYSDYESVLDDKFDFGRATLMVKLKLEEILEGKEDFKNTAIDKVEEKEEKLSKSLSFKKELINENIGNYYLESGISGKVTSKGSTKVALNLELENTKEKATKKAEDLSTGIKFKNISIPTEAGSIEIGKDKDGANVSFNLEVEDESGATIKAPIKITKKGIELGLSATLTDPISKTKTTFAIKQKGIDTYLTVNKAIDNTWSKNNISCYYKAYAEYGAKLDYNNSDTGASYATALAYAIAENLQSLEIDGIEDKEIDWDSIRVYINEHYDEDIVNEILPIIEEFERDNVSTWDKFCAKLKSINWGKIGKGILIIVIAIVIVVLLYFIPEIITVIRSYLPKILTTIIHLLTNI